ncbi:MAG TPA: SMC-Scp complex subunit ScpB [Polyangiaceae bacterium]|jgi:segregation and condensation protein B
MKRPPKPDSVAPGEAPVAEAPPEPAQPAAPELTTDDAPELTTDDAPTRDDIAVLALAARGEEAEDAEAGVEQAREISLAHLRGLIEALVFAADKPLRAREVARLASAPVAQVKELLGELAGFYAQRGIMLAEIAGGWAFRTHAQYAPFVRELTSERPVRLTRAQVETLAIVAYRQPVTRPEIDEIRGVDSGATLKLLLERELLRILGKKEEPGRPMLYGTTPKFLEFFNLKALSDLPTLREFTELNEDSRRIAEAELGDGMEAVGAPRDTIAPTEGRDTMVPPTGAGSSAGEAEGPDPRGGESEVGEFEESEPGGFDESD